MLAKLTAKNQITIPKSIMAKLPKAEYFDVEFQDGVISLRPVNVSQVSIEGVRDKMKQLGLTEDSVVEAIRWARQKP